MIETPAKWNPRSINLELLMGIEILIGMLANPGDNGGILPMIA